MWRLIPLAMFLLLLLNETVAQSYLSPSSPFVFSELKEKRLIIKSNFSSTVYPWLSSGRVSGTVGYESFKSNSKSQKLLQIDLNLTKQIDYNERSLTYFNINPQLRFDASWYNKNNYYFNLGTATSFGHTPQENRSTLFQRVSLGIGKGRIDRVSEKAIAETILSRFMHSFSGGNEAVLDKLCMEIRRLKNDRKLTNLGNRDQEVIALHSFMKALDVTNSNLVDEIAVRILQPIYKFEPTLDRLNGTRYGWHNEVTGFYNLRDGLFDPWRTFSNVSTKLFYQQHKYINSKWQFDKEVYVSTIWYENYDRGYGITESISGSVDYFYNLSTKLGCSVALFNRNHTLDEIVSYGYSAELNLRKAISQRGYAELALNTEVTNRVALYRLLIQVNI